MVVTRAKVLTREFEPSDSHIQLMSVIYITHYFCTLLYHLKSIGIYKYHLL